jgi:miniconductance mechanosensitive channel
MIIQRAGEWIQAYPYLFYPVLIAASYGLYRLLRLILARGLYYIAIRTKNIYDDLIVDRLHPFRVAWLLPLILIYVFADLALGRGAFLRDAALLLIIVVSADFGIALLGGLNDVYENRPTYSGKSIAAYLDILKILVVVGAVVLGLSLLTQLPSAQLLAGFGAWLAVLMLIFHDTILNFVASIQISTQELVKAGDWIDVPSYDASGTVTDISLHAIKVSNYDNTFTVIPTHRMVDVAYKNSRGIEDSGGRAIEATLHLDVHSVKFCDLALLKRLANYDLISKVVEDQIEQLADDELAEAGPIDFPLDGPQITNLQLYAQYAQAYLKSRGDVRRRRLPLVVRVRPPSSEGVPLTILAFSRSTDWEANQATRGEILMHLMAAAPYFDLELHQHPSGTDLARLAGRQAHGQGTGL